MQLQRTHAVALTALVVVSALLASPAAGGLVAQESGPPAPDQENRPPTDGADFIVRPDDPRPDTGTTYTMLARGAGPWDGSRGLQEIDNYKITTQDTRFQDCSPDDARAFGIDRNNDDPGTGTDEPLLRHMKSYSVDGRVIAVEIYDDSDLGGAPTFLNDTDETVAQLANCVVTPSEPGWYQFKGYVNGTNYAGNYQEVLIYTEYFYICDCDSEAEAEERLGPRPHSGSDTDSGSTDDSTATATATDTATPERGDSSTATAAGTATATETATETRTDTATPTRADTATGEPDADDGDDADSGDGGDGTAATATGTAAASGDDGGQGAQPRRNQQGGGAATPTIAEGPGFGAVAALVGLLTVALLALRRR
jgi:PGF-CTERM protein